MDTFSHISNTQRENANVIFTSDKLDKSEDLVDAEKNLTINNTKYYESGISTVNDVQGDLKCNPETVTHASNGNKTVTHTNNRNFKQNLLSNRTIPVVVPMMNLNIDQRIAPIVLAPQTLFTPATKEVITDAASGRAWVNRTPRQGIRTGVYRITPGEILNAVSLKDAPSPVRIGIVATSPAFGLNASLQVENKLQSTSPTSVGNAQKLDAIVDEKFPNDLYYVYIFSNLIGHKVSNGSSGDLFLCCRMNFADDVFQT